MQWPHSTHPHSGVSTAPTDYYSEVVIVHTCAVHSPWLPGYIDVAQTVLIILQMAGLFLDRPHMYMSKI